jgi:AcrR family transcriptional regulator
MPTREQKVARTRQAVVDAALQLLANRSFDAVSVDEIAREAGIGRRTFFRYFPTKEDVVLDPRRLDRAYALDAMAHRVDGEDDIQLLLRVMTELQRRAFEHVRPEDQPVLHRLSHAEPALMARSWLLLEAARDLLVEGLVGTDATPPQRRRARVFVGACLMTVDAAVTSWIESGMTTSLGDALLAAERDLRDSIRDPADASPRR